jgi:tRNA A-37 threonylcarbamoyl transferase component Bud32
LAVERIQLDGGPAWRKRYADDRRAWALGAMAAVARLLHEPPLRPPPRHDPRTMRSIEAGRLRKLQALGIRAPQVLGEGPDWLLLSDLGPTLSSRLRAAQGDRNVVDGLVRGAIEAIAAAHGRDAYFGQPLPRNLTVEDGHVGFLDFEEDPLEVMTLAQAQARDWLLFAYGVARYYDDRPQALAELLREGLACVPVQAAHQARQAARRLRPLALLARRLGREARALGHAVFALHQDWDRSGIRPGTDVR